MNTTLSKPILGGIIGTAIMTLLMFVAPMMGMPKMSPPEMLAGMMGVPVFIGWFMHFMVGIVFAFSYVILLHRIITVSNLLLKGIIFGLIVFIFAQIMMATMSFIFPMPKSDDSMLLMMLGSIMGHALYGAITVKIIGHFDA